MASNTIIDEQVGNWYFRARVTSMGGEWTGLAWCAQTPDLGNGPLDIDYSREDVHFEFGETPEDALRRLKTKVFS